LIEKILIGIYDNFLIILLSTFIIFKYILKLGTNKALITIIFLLALYFTIPFYFLFMFSNNDIIVYLNLNFNIIATILFFILPILCILFAVIIFKWKKINIFKFIIIVPIIYILALALMYFLQLMSQK